MKVGFIGTGNMGVLIAGHVLAGGHELKVFDLRKEAAEPLLQRGARWADSMGEVAAGADLVIASLPTPAVVEQVIWGDGGLLGAIAPNACFIDTTTNDPALATKVAAALQERDVDMLEVPVTGGVNAAAAGTLVGMVGGKAEVLDRYHTLLELFCGSLFHLGDVGSGNTAKVITNLLAIANTMVAAEGMVLGRRAGLDLETLWKVINASVGRSFASDFYFPNGVFDGSFPVRFRLDLMAKDIGIVTRMGRELGLPLNLSSLVDKYLTEARGQGLGSASNSAVVRLIEQESGTDLRISGFQAPAKPVQAAR